MGVHTGCEIRRYSIALKGCTVLVAVTRGRILPPVGLSSKKTGFSNGLGHNKSKVAGAPAETELTV